MCVLPCVCSLSCPPQQQLGSAVRGDIPPEQLSSLWGFDIGGSHISPITQGNDKSSGCLLHPPGMTVVATIYREFKNRCLFRGTCLTKFVLQLNMALVLQ